MDRFTAVRKWLDEHVTVIEAVSTLEIENITFQIDEYGGKFDAEQPGPGREIILQTESTEAVHHGESRDPDRIKALYRIDQTLKDPAPEKIVVCDDVLTTGAHYKAAQSLLSSIYPEVQIVGMFIARRAPEAIDFEKY